MYGVFIMFGFLNDRLVVMYIFDLFFMGGCCWLKIVKYRKWIRCRVIYKMVKYNDLGICFEILKNFLEDVDFIEYSM